MDPRDYLSVALQRLDLLLHREILRLRANYQLSLDEFRGLYISDEQVNQLVNRAVNYRGASSAIDELTDKAESLRAEAKQRSDGSPWQTLVAEFSLSPDRGGYLVARRRAGNRSQVRNALRLPE